MQVDDVYDSSQRAHPLVEEIKALFKYRELVFQFISRSIKLRYKRSFLGVVWTLLNPLLTMIVLTVVFSSVFRFSIEHYPVYILNGLVAWLFFSSSSQGAMGEMIWSGALLNRIYVPKSVFPVSAVGTGLFNLGISLLPLFVISIFLGVKIRPAVLTMLPATLLLALFTLGIGMLLATASVYFADMLPVYEVLLTLWMYSTPIIYPVEIIPVDLMPIFQANPLYHMLSLFRDPLFSGTIPGWQTWGISAAFALTAFLLGAWVFTSKAHEYAYRI